MTALDRYQSSQLARRNTPSWALPRRVDRSLSRLSDDTTRGVAQVHATGIVATEMAWEVDNLARECMTGQALLARHREVLAGNDPLLHDELRFFSEVARVGKGELIADTISAFCRMARS